MTLSAECDIVLVFPPIRTWDNPRNFPTGIGLLAARLRHAGYRVQVIDVNGLRISESETIQRIEDCHPAIVGFGGLITTYGWIKRVSQNIRQNNPGRKIILGGSVGTSIVETALKHLAIDVIAIAEADDTILELVPALLNHESLNHIAGLAWLEDNRVVRTAARPMRENLDSLPMPAWDLFPMDVYLNNPIVGVGKDIDIISSRGCPFPCHYCYRIFGRHYRGRSAAHVIEEMQQLKSNYDIDFISFQDDCFVIDKPRVYAICDLLDQTGLSRSLRWSCTGRVTVCDYDMLKRMRASGCVSVSYGIESGSETILKAMGKNASLEQARKAIANTRKAGLRCPVSFMIGYPGETRETVMETVAFCKDLNIPLSAMMFTCPYPGTPLYEQVKSSKRFLSQFPSEEDFVLSLGDAVDLTVNMTDMDNETLYDLRIEALEMARQNYISPSAEVTERQERELYGDTLFEKARQQRRNPQNQAHLQRHGFNENAGLKQD